MKQSYEKRVHVNINLDPSVFEHSKQNCDIKSFSDWANRTYREQFMQTDDAHTLKGGLEESEWNWIKCQGVSRIKNGTLDGVYRLFINLSGKLELDKEQFKKILEAARDELKTEGKAPSKLSEDQREGIIIKENGDSRELSLEKQLSNVEVTDGK